MRDHFPLNGLRFRHAVEARCLSGACPALATIETEGLMGPPQNPPRGWTLVFHRPNGAIESWSAVCPDCSEERQETQPSGPTANAAEHPKGDARALGREGVE